MYSILDFGEMIADEGRMSAYSKALRDAVTPDSVVLDIGTGTGIFALLSCKYGARKVYAIEPDSSIQVARELAQANGFSDRIEFIQDLSTSIELPEPATIIISDLRGRLPLYGHHLPSIIDARKRHLAASGVLLAAQDILWAAVVEAPEIYQRYSEPWSGKNFGIDMDPVKNMVMNTIWGTKNLDARFLTERERWVTLDYSTLESPHVERKMEWTVEHRGIIHGFRVWFDSVLSASAGFTNRPGQEEHIYGSLFFPWLEPVGVEVGDRVTIFLKANLVGDDYVWRWESKVFSKAKGHPDKKLADFKQSSFSGMPISLTNLSKSAANYKPTLSQSGNLDQKIMNMMAEGRLLEDIAREMAEQFPDLFSDWQHALAHVGELSQKYSQ